MKKYWFLIAAIGVFLLAFFLRFYKLGEIPHGFYQDESAIGYNAYSVLTTGRDEYGKLFPLYFKSFGDYKLPVYIYLTIPSILFFGMTEFAVRLPSAFFGFLTVVASFFLVGELTKDKKLALLTSFLMAINPWSLDYNRATFEVSVGMFLFVFGTYLISKSFTSYAKGTFFFGTICFLISLYSYNLTRLFTPVLFIAVIYYFLKRKKKLPRKEVILTAIVLSVSLIPFITTFFSGGGVSSAKGTLLFTSAAVQAPLLELRSYLVNLPPIITKLFFNSVVLDIWQYLNNVVLYLSTQFFFVSGSTHGNHGIGTSGEFYIFELLFIAIGIIFSIQQKYRWSYLLICWIVITILVAGLTRDIPHATRSFFMVVPLEIFSALGILQFIQFAKQKRQGVKTILFLGMGIFMLYNIIFYFTSYYVRFPIAYAKSWQLEDKELSMYLKNNDSKYNQIIFDNKAGFVYTSFLFYTKYSPTAFQKTAVRVPDDSEGFSHVVSFGKYIFKDIDWAKDYKKGVLLITTPNLSPSGIPIVKTFFFPQRPVVFNVGQVIHLYPITETAYVVVEGK